ncbi:MAG: peptidoglycan-binding protein [Parcubacteria group bacterium]|nr:peptidoglycan-binding protein [Parcubacteria group bacterium]
MSKFLKKAITTAAAASIAVSMVAPMPAGAVTIAELQAQIDALLVQLQQLQAQQGSGAGATACTFTRSLYVGVSSGDDVMCLQQYLNGAGHQLASSGAGSPGSETTFYGSRTQAAVAAWQAANGVSPAVGYFGPISRAKYTAVAGTAPSTPGTPSTPSTPGAPTPPAQAGTLSVSLASDTPASATVADAGNVNVTKFFLSAGASDVAISTIWLTRYGLTANADVENIRILDEDGVRVGSLGSLNTNSRAQMTFSTNLKIPANTSKAFFIRVGIVDGTAGAKTVAMGIASAADISAGSATVTGAFPIKGNDFTTVALTIGTVDVQEDGALVDSTPDVGDTDVTVNAFKVTVGSTEDVTLEQITVMESGSASLDDTTNIELYDVSKSQSLGTTQWSGEGKASWSNLNMVIAKGDSRRFKIMLDVVDGPSLTINADLMDGSDVLISTKGNTYGMYITPDGNDAADWTNANDGLAANNQTINSGALSVSKSSTTAPTGNIAQAADQNLATWDLNAIGESVKLTSVRISFDLGTMLDAELTAVKLFDENGTLVAGPLDPSTTDYTANGTTYEVSVTYTDTIIVPVGVHKYTVKGRIATATSAGDTIQAAIADPDTDLTVTGMTSNNSITATPTASAAAGNTQTVKAGALVVNTLVSPAARDVAVGTSDFIFAKLALDAGASGEDVQVSSITIQNDPGTGAPADDMINVEIWANLTTASSSRGDVYETKVSNTTSYDSTTDGTADTIAFTLTQTLIVKKGTTMELAVVADLKANADTGASGNLTDAHQVAETATTATGADTGNDITETRSGAGQVMSVVTGGTLTTSVDSSQPSSSLFAASTTGNTIGIFRLASDAVEDLDLDEISLQVSGSNFIQTLHLYNGSTLLKSVSAGGASPQSLSDITFDDGTLTIPSNGYQLITVKADFFSNTSAAAQNDVATGVAIRDVDTTGKGSGTTVSDAAPTGSSNTHRMFRAYPKFTVNSTTPSGNLIPSANTLLAKFDVTAVGSDDVTFQNGDGNKLVVNITQSISTSDGTEETFTLQDPDGTIYSNAISAVGTGEEGQVDESTSESVTFTFATTELRVPAGQTKTLLIYSDTTELDTDGDQIQLWLSDVADSNVEFGVDGTSNAYRRGTIIFRPDIYAGSLVNP